MTLVTIEMAAAAVDRNERTVRRWITQGMLKEYPTASGRRVSLRDVMIVEANVRSAPRRRQMERIASIFEPV